MIPLNSDSHFAALKARIANRLRGEWRRCLPEALIRRAVEEAEHTARSTDFPTLFFPLLAEEKVRAVCEAVHSDFISRAA